MTGAHPSRGIAAWVGSLYLAQGLVYGFGAFVLLPRLAAAGTSLADQASLVALAGLPWVLKLLWAPWIDAARRSARGGPQRWAAGALVVAALASVALAAQIGALSGPATGWGVAASWLVLNLAMSLQDVSADALVLDAIAPARRGLAGAIMLGAHHLGWAGLGGVALGVVAARFGLDRALLVQAGLLLALAGGLPWIRVEVSTREGRASFRWADLAAPLRSSGARRVLLVACLAFVADVLTSAISAEWLVHELRWSPERIAALLPPVAGASALRGFGLAALVADRFGHRRTAALGSLALGAVWIGFGAGQPLWSAEGFVVGTIALQGLATALLGVGLQAWLMTHVEPAARATHFAILTAGLNLPRAIVPWIAPDVLAQLGYIGLFVAAGTYQLAYGGLLMGRRTRRPEGL